nr:dihydrofolate reductase family protein [Candidatus Sigynarchaeota archaeon]
MQRVHALRDAVDGICVGIGTVLVDNPTLRVKHVEHARNPHRIVVDSRLNIPVDAALINKERA